jgi:hypothetical protein
VDRLNPITVLAVGLSGVLGDILRREAAQHGGVRFVGEVDAAEQLVPELRRAPAELVLYALEDGVTPKLFRDVLALAPDTRVLAIEEDGRRASLFLGDVSALELLQLIHSIRRTQPAT